MDNWVYYPSPYIYIWVNGINSYIMYSINRLYKKNVNINQLFYIYIQTIRYKYNIFNLQDIKLYLRLYYNHLL